MEQVKKRFQKNENSNGRADSSDTDLSNEDQESIPTIPTLVSEIVLEELRDVMLLKTCRLVCKSWNIVASKSLRACSLVLLKENSSKLKNFAALLRKRELRSVQHFPSPFQNFHVEVTSFTKPTFINLVFTPSVTCTSLRIYLSGKDSMDLDQSQLSLFLAANKDSITDLTITANNNPLFQLNPTLVTDAIRLTSLKRFQFTEYFRRYPDIQFLQNMRTRRSTYLNIVVDKSAPNPVLQDIVTHIKDLHLFCEGISWNVLKNLADTGFQLKTLSLFDIDFDSNEDLQEFYSFFKNVSPSLVDFRTNLPIATKLRFPKLKEISIQNNVNGLSVITENNFPSLTKFILHVQTPILPSWENYEAPHKGVQYCVIEAPDITWYIDGDHDREHDLFMLLMFVSRQFPNVTSLDFFINRFQSSTLTDIRKAFPRLKTLTLDGECDFFSFAGFTTSSLNLGLPVEMIPRRESILDFKELEVIKFGIRFRVTPEMIRDCLPRILKLKQIELEWNITLSAALFGDFLGHLDKIEISDSDEFFETEILEVQQLLPNSVVML